MSSKKIVHYILGGSRIACYLLLVVFSAPMAASAVDMPDGYTHLGWIESDKTAKQWINTGYVPNAQTVIRASFRLYSPSENWAAAFGVFNVNDNSSYGVVCRYAWSNATLNGLFCNSSYAEAQIACPANGDYDVELKSGGITIGNTTATITTQPGNLANFSHSVYVFCENNVGTARRHQPIRLYSMTIVESDGSTETLKRNFLPCIDTNGKYGLWDTVEGAFHGNQASGADFTGGGLRYIVDSGVMTAYEGELPAGAMTGVMGLEKVSSATFGVSAYNALPATAVTDGELSFQNDAATAVTVTSLELYGGTALGFDVTTSGCDSLAVGALTLDSSVTSANPVTIKVNPYGVVGIETPLTLISGGNLAAADIDLFTLDAALPAVLEIDNGNLVLAPVPVDPGVWTGAGGNGNWSTAGNWVDGVPAAGAPITLGVATGGSTTLDLSGYAAKSVTIPATSGSYTHGGNALAVTGSFTDNSTVEQTFTMPLTLGVAGSTFAVTSAGNLNFTGAVTANAATLTFAPAAGATNKVAAISGSGTLAKTGAGVLELTAQNPDFTGDVEITGGTLLSDVATPFTTAGLGNKISVSNGGTLDLGPDSIAQDAINYNSRTLEIGGHGVDGKGAVVYNVSGKHQYNAFHLAKLTADATVGGAAGRWDVRAANGLGTFDFNGFNLTKVGANEFALSGVEIQTGENPVSLNVNEGNVLIESGAKALGYGNAINVASGAKISFYQLATPLEWAMNFADGAVLDAREAGIAQNIFAGSVAVPSGTAEMSVKAQGNATVTGAISGAGGVKKTNGGYLHFSGNAKTYSGGTEVAGGRLYVPSKDQLPGYGTVGKVSITGEGAGVVLESTGWALSDFDALLSSATISNWKGYVGYEAKEPVTLDTARTLSMGSLMLGGGEAPITVAEDITLSDGMLVTSGDVSISGSNTLVSVKRLELSDRDAVLSVTNGASVEITSLTRNVGDIVLGNVFATPPYVHRLYVENGSVAANPLPTKGAQTSSIFVGYANNAVGILEVGDGGYVAHRIVGAAPDWSRGAILIREGGTVVNYGGTGNNDGYISGNGYGFMENAGTYEVKGYSQVVNIGARAVGILYNSGNLLFTGEHDGELDVSRGGTGVVYQTSGTIEAVKNGFQFNSQHGSEIGLAIWTVDGTNAVSKAPTFYPVNKNKTTSILTLREGGTLDYRVISPRTVNYGSLETQPFYVNLAGGFLKPQESGTVFKEGGDGRYMPNTVVAFDGGAGFDIGEGITSTLNFPVTKPTGRGIASVTPSAEALAQEYIGAPYVNIMGDGYGATAVAIYDSTTRRITGVKVTSPGCNYTTATVKLEGGRLDNNTAHDATVTLTPEGEDQVCGGIVKKGAGKLVASTANIPTNAPLAVLAGELDLEGATYATPNLIAGGGSIAGSVVAGNLTSVGASPAVSVSGTLAFSEGATVTGNFDYANNLKFVLAVAEGGITGAEGLTVSPAPPKGWKCKVVGKRLLLVKAAGFYVIVR